MAANPKNFELYDYQLEGVRHLKKPLRALYLADAPGLGKTVQSIVAATELNAQSVLVLCPAAVVGQWQPWLAGFRRAEVVSYESLAMSPPRKHKSSCPKAKEAPPPRPPKPKPKPKGTLNVLMAEDDEEEEQVIPWVCVACGFRYEDTETIRKKLLAQLKRKRLKELGPWDLMIADEAHFLKERGSNRTGYIVDSRWGIFNFALKIFLLSGTPMLNRPAELFAILRACYPEALFDCPTWEAYAYRFCGSADAKGWNDSLNADGASNSEELGRRLQPFMLMRDQSVLGDKLPGVTIIDHDLVVERFIDKKEHIATRRRQTGEAKAEQLVENIAQVAKDSGKLVVFYYHDSVRVALSRRFPHCSIIKGGMSSHEKAQAIERFQKLALIEVILVQLGAGGVGLDGLQHCAHVGYIAELDWTPALLDQAIGRLRRLGQKHHVTIHRPIGKQQGLDQHIKKMLASKTIVINDVMMHVTRNSTGDDAMSEFDLRGETQRVIAEAAQALKTRTLREPSLREVVGFRDAVVEEESESMDTEQFNQLLEAQQMTNQLLEVLIDAVAGNAPEKPKRTKKQEHKNDPPQPAIPGVVDVEAEVVPAPAPEPEPEPEIKFMSHDEASAILKAELYSDPGAVERKGPLLMEFAKANGVAGVTEVAPEKIEAYVSGALAAMQAPPPAPATPSFSV